MFLKKNIRHLVRASPGPWDTFASSPYCTLKVPCTQLSRGSAVSLRTLSCVFPSLDWFIQQICFSILHLSGTGTQWWIKSIRLVIQTGMNQMLEWRSRFSGDMRFSHEVNEVSGGQNLPRCNVGWPFVPIRKGKPDCEPCSVSPLDLVFLPNSSF